MCTATIPIEKLKAHSKEFRKDIIRLDTAIYVAIGYAASNVSMLIGDEGIVIIDCTESTAAAENILFEFRKITELPVKAIIYTHSHRDHIGGASVFAEGAEPQIISRANLELDILEDDNASPSPKQIMLQRTKRQFGIGLEDQTERINLGVGPSDRPLKGMGAGFVPPTRMFSEDSIKLNICGIDLELHAAPGETEDHLVVWWPAKKTLFSGDNFYKSFPNLYAIRGTRYRDFDVWANTMEKLADFDADTLVPGHSRPLTGCDTIKQQLADYGAAIRSIIAQTAAAMNRGETPLEIIQHVSLPEDLASKPYLQEFYGTVAWSSRAYFAGTVGWFDGNPTHLFPLSPHDKASRWVALAGGAENVMHQIKRAQDNSEWQWSCELADVLLDINYQSEIVKTLKACALQQLADQQINATARNYYLLYAKELRDSTQVEQHYD